MNARSGETPLLSSSTSLILLILLSLLILARSGLWSRGGLARRNNPNDLTWAGYSSVWDAILTLEANGYPRSNYRIYKFYGPPDRYSLYAAAWKGDLSEVSWATVTEGPRSSALYTYDRRPRRMGNVFSSVTIAKAPGLHDNFDWSTFQSLIIERNPYRG